MRRPGSHRRRRAAAKTTSKQGQLKKQGAEPLRKHICDKYAGMILTKMWTVPRPWQRGSQARPPSRGTGRGLRQLPGLFPARGGVAGHEQRGVEQHDSLRGQMGWGRQRPSAPLWCGCSSSLIPVLGAAALGAACGSSLGFVSRTGAPLGTSSGAWSSTTAPVGRWGLGPSDARCALWCGCCSSLTPVLGAAAWLWTCACAFGISRC